MRSAPPAWAAASGPLLVGALVGSMAAGRLETGALCLAVAGALAWTLGASWPSRPWLASLGLSATLGWLLNLYLTPGDPLAGWPRIAGRAPSEQGLAMGGLLTLRLCGAMAALQGLRAAWDREGAADRLALALAPLRRLRVPVGDLRVMLGLALRFAPLLGVEARRIAAVQDLRAGRPPRGPRDWLVRRRAAAVPTLVNAIERAERVALALEARQYRLRPIEPPREGRTHPAWLLAGAAVAATACFWRS